MIEVVWGELLTIGHDVSDDVCLHCALHLVLAGVFIGSPSSRAICLVNLYGVLCCLGERLPLFLEDMNDLISSITLLLRANRGIIHGPQLPSFCLCASVGHHVPPNHEAALAKIGKKGFAK